jgi:molecular chaperone DnaJ
MFLKLKRFYCFSNNYNIHKNYYQILGVTTAAPADDIKRAYKLLAKQYHPDVNKGKEEQFKNINEAYQVLSDSHLRSQYDSARISPHMN